MIADGRALSAGQELGSAVCVVGAGPVGIAVALALADAGTEVVLLESGGETPDRAAAALDAPEEIRFGLVERLGNNRELGGNANAWQVRTGVSDRGVRLCPLDGIGSRRRWGVGWPIEDADLTRFHQGAGKFFGLDRRGFEPGSWATAQDRPEVLDGPELKTAIFQFGDGGTLVRSWRERLRADRRIRCLQHATAIEVDTDEGGIATGVRFASAPGRQGFVRARHVVLAAGCIESTRLLLASDRIRPAGLGNASGALGRHFMDHLIVHGGRLVPEDRLDIAARAFYDLRLVDGSPVLAHLRLTPDAAREAGAVSMSAILFPREDVAPPTYSRRQEQGALAALAVRESLVRHRPPRVRDALAFVAGFDGAMTKKLDALRRPKATLGRGGWSTRPGAVQARYAFFEVVHQVEQPPHADNRVVLGTERDALGARRVRLTWTWRDSDIAATITGQELLAEGLARAGWGRFQISSVGGRPEVTSWSSNHFMGTTRMSERPEDGVVDRNCAVHGTPNVYVASSSVFPTGGYANPTLTTVALAIRIAEALSRP